MASAKRIRIYLEVGRHRTFAGAIDWPGWCRSGRGEDAAVGALLQAAPRYARALRSSRLGFPSSLDADSLVVAERLKGNATTDYGAPDRSPAGDEGRVPEKEVLRLQSILRACWRTFDAAAKAADGRTLRKGPRGGGRDLEAIARHALDSEAAYLGMLGQKYKPGDGDVQKELQQIHRATLQALAAAAPHGTPPPGPRGGARWSPRYFVRRVAWHVLDHAWEIEDRVL